MTALLTNGTLLVDASLQLEAAAIVTKARDRNFVGVKIVADDGTETELPASLGAFFGRVLEGVSRGPISITTIPDELTTTVAADFLGMSRPTLMKAVADGRLPAHKVGTHTRIRRDDVFTFKKALRTERREAFAALRALDEQFDEGDAALT